MAVSEIGDATIYACRSCGRSLVGVRSFKDDAEARKASGYRLKSTWSAARSTCSSISVPDPSGSPGRNARLFRLELARRPPQCSVVVRKARARSRGGRGADLRGAGAGSDGVSARRCAPARAASPPPMWTARSPRTGRSSSRGSTAARSTCPQRGLSARSGGHHAAASDEQRAQAGPGGCSAADVERGIETIERSLAGEGPLTSDALRERVAATGVRAEGQALTTCSSRPRSTACGARAHVGEEAGVRARAGLVAGREARGP